MSHWITYDASDKSKILDKPGCYVIYLDGQLSYIGQAKSAARRIGSYGIKFGYGSGIFHCVGGADGQARSLLIKIRYSTRIGDWAMREIRLIRKLQPPLNYAHGGKKKRAVGKAPKSPRVVYVEQPDSHDLMIEVMADEQIRHEKEAARELRYFMSRGAVRI